MKYGGGSMLCGCFAAWEIDALYNIGDIMTNEQYVEILKQHLKISARKIKLGHKQDFQMESGPNHTTKLVTKWLKKNTIYISYKCQKALISISLNILLGKINVLPVRMDQIFM